MPRYHQRHVNLILLTPEDFSGTGRVLLTGRRREHVDEVHRATVGDGLIVGLLNGRIGTGRIVRLDAESMEMEVSLERDPPPPLPLTLLLALPRPKVLSRILFTASVMGVKRIHLINSWRVEKSFWDSPRLDRHAVRTQLMLGLEQAGDTMLPEVRIERRFRPFVEDELPALATGTRALVAHPAAIDPCPLGTEGEVTLAIGPEGGFISGEITMFQANGFQAVTLGNRILTVEAAIPALLGRLF